MTANKHTPGPWNYEVTNSAHASYVVVSANQYANGSTVVIGQCAGPDRLENAHLIASAPELLEILRNILPFVATQAIGCHGDKCREEWCFSCNGEEDAEAAAKRGSEFFAEAHSLIAKATGGAA